MTYCSVLKEAVHSGALSGGLARLSKCISSQVLRLVKLLESMWIFCNEVLIFDYSKNMVSDCMNTWRYLLLAVLILSYAKWLIISCPLSTSLAKRRISHLLILLRVHLRHIRSNNDWNVRRIMKVKLIWFILY